MTATPPDDHAATPDGSERHHEAMDTETYDCERAGELVHLYVGGDLEPAEERGVEAHLTGCEPCREAEAEARRLRQIYFEAAAADAAVDLWPGVRRALLAEGRLAQTEHAEQSDRMPVESMPSLAASDEGPLESSAELAVQPIEVPAAAITGLAPSETSDSTRSTGGRLLSGRFGGGAAAVAAALLALVGAQLLFGPGTGDTRLDVQDGSLSGHGLAEVKGSLDPDATPTGLVGSGPTADALAGSGLADAGGSAAGLRPINRDERLLEAPEVLVPVQGFPVHLVPTGPESLASYR